MKTNLILILTAALLNLQCVSLTVSDIKADVDAQTDVVATIYFDGTIHSDIPTSYTLYKNKSNANSMDISFKDFSGENYLYLNINEPTVLDLNILANFTSANLSISLENSRNQTIWSTDFNGDFYDENRVESVDITSIGNYKLLVKGKAIKGNYKIQWN